jgi:hypothetical protein
MICLVMNKKFRIGSSSWVRIAVKEDKMFVDYGSPWLDTSIPSWFCTEHFLFPFAKPVKDEWDKMSHYVMQSLQAYCKMYPITIKHIVYRPHILCVNRAYRLRKKDYKICTKEMLKAIKDIRKLEISSDFA